MRKVLKLVMVGALCMGILVGCGSSDKKEDSAKTEDTKKAEKQEEPKKEEPKKEDKKAAEVVSKDAEKPAEQPEQKPESNTAEPAAPVPAMLDEATKSAIKSFVEPCIDDTYKTSFYVCDILTPSSGEGGIVSIQMEGEGFADEATCVTAIKDTIGKMLGQDGYKNINSFQFTMLEDSQMKFMIDVNGAQELQSVDDIDSHLSTTSF